MLSERLLGFDVRECWVAPGVLWDDSRRQRYLLRLDVAKPLSVDQIVWPSVFDAGEGRGIVGSLYRPHGLFAVDTPAWIGPTGKLWENLAAMRRHLAAGWPDPRTHAVIAVSVIDDEGAADGPEGGETDPVTPAADWLRLGFDVADRWQLSGLTNCGYDAGEVDELRRRWAPQLNAHHLFHDESAAREFRDLTNPRVPEHAPFFVYGLYLVERVG